MEEVKEEDEEGYEKADEEVTLEETKEPEK